MSTRTVKARLDRGNAEVVRLRQLCLGMMRLIHEHTVRPIDKQRFEAAIRELEPIVEKTY